MDQNRLVVKKTTYTLLDRKFGEISIFDPLKGIHVVGKGSWKKRGIGKVEIRKFEVRKLPFKLASFQCSIK